MDPQKWTFPATNNNNNTMDDAATALSAHFKVLLKESFKKKKQGQEPVEVTISLFFRGVHLVNIALTRQQSLFDIET